MPMPGMPSTSLRGLLTLAFLAVNVSAADSYEYIVVGSGAGGGVVATRLAEGGFKVLLIESGKDLQTPGTMIPAFAGTTWEDPEIVLDYYQEYYPAGQPRVRNWYPRAEVLGGCAVHSALANFISHDWDWNNIAQLTGDSSWRANEMHKYYSRIENNLYVPKAEGEPLGYGYGGWLSTSRGPNMDLPPYRDPVRLDLESGLRAAFPPVPNEDWNLFSNDQKEGGAIAVQATNATHYRSSIRDHIVATQARIPDKLTVWTETYATKILFEKVGNVTFARGIQYAQGRGINPYSRLFKANQTLTFKEVFATKEVIISGGPFETPKLLMQSGIGERALLTQYGIDVVVDLPGVGKNYQDRVEMNNAYFLNTPFATPTACLPGTTGPCQDDYTRNTTHPFFSANGFWSASYKSSPDLPYRDVWNHFIGGLFRGFHRNGEPDPLIPWPTTALAPTLDKRQGFPGMLGNLIIKAHHHSKGWIKITGKGPHTTLDMNRNLFQTPESAADLEILANAIQRFRQVVKTTPGISDKIASEAYPGAQYATNEQLKDFIKRDTWGHHPCCTAKIGADSDPEAVLDTRFRVRGVKGLRAVDSSSFPNIPGWYITVPIYMLAGKAGDVILEDAAAAA